MLSFQDNIHTDIRTKVLEAPVSFIPYGRQWIDEEDIQAVIEVLRSDWLTTGPKVSEFEQVVSDYVGAKHGVAVSSGTAALHCAMNALAVGPGDEVIVPPMTFASTVNCVVFQGGTPVFSDVDPETLLMDSAEVEKKITAKTRAIIAVDYAGQPCDFDRLREIANAHDVALIDDGCHALGAEYKGFKLGSLADMTVFSFHPVKHIATGEGGMIVTDSDNLEKRLRLFRNHGITRDPKCFSPQTSDLRPQASDCSWYYEMEDLGYNYRIPDIQCALGISQMRKLSRFLQIRREIAAHYDEALSDIPGIKPLGRRADVMPASQSERSSPYALRPALCAMPSIHAYHLYVVRINKEESGKVRSMAFHELEEQGIQVNVHYIPVHLHPYYRKTFHTGPGDCPVAEKAYEEVLSLPMHPGMSNDDVEQVIRVLKSVFSS